MNEPDRLCSDCRYWARRLEETGAGQPCEGECRRYPPGGVPAGAPAGASQPGRAGWPRTFDQDWCGEWAAANELPPDDSLDPEEERWLRNASIAQALTMLPADKRDRLLLEVLTEEERACPTPPDDFYERVQIYLAGR